MSKKKTPNQKKPWLLRRWKKRLVKHRLRPHDLEYLVGIAGLSPDKDIERFVVEIGNPGVVTRYPQDFQRMVKDFSLERAEFILVETKEIFQWIRKSIPS